MTLSLYTLHSTPTSGEFIIQKFDTDYHCESVYACTTTTCMCPQGHKPNCRHRTMLPMFLKHGHIGDGWFLQWENRLWRRPVNDIEAVASHNRQAMVTVERAGLDQSVATTSMLADETVMGTSALGEDGLSPIQAPPPPSPPEGNSLPPSAEVAPARRVGAGATFVKRRRVP